MTRINIRHRFFYYLIAIGFLIYGGIRTIGAMLAVGQAMGWSNTLIGRKVVDLVATALPDMSAQAFVPVSTATYFAYSLVMGIFLTAGSLLAIARVRMGYACMALYFIMFPVMFINYQVVNEKVAHLIVSLVLFLTMLWLAGGRNYAKQSTSTQNILPA